MRKRLACTVVVVLGTGMLSTASAQLLMKGSETLGDVTKSVINSCVAGPISPGNTANLPLFDPTFFGLAGGIRFADGTGSGAGQVALLAGQQRIAPMTRALNGSVACPGGANGIQGVLDARGEQLLIGLDSVAVVGANQAHGDSRQDPPPPGQTGGCDDGIVGVQLSATLFGGVCQGLTIDGCDPTNNPPGTYTFADWRDVLVMLYGGQNHVTTQAQLLPNSGHCSVTTATVCSFNSDCPATETCVLEGRRRNPARIDCTNPIRKALADSWGTLFETSCGRSFSPTDPSKQACIKLKHAFRRGDLSGTTDTFTTLVGMLPTQAATSVAVNNFEAIQDSTATASPFCNAGTKPRNKGHADYLDLDPIRRIADSANASLMRIGYEQVAEPGLTPSNPPSPLIPDLRPDPPVGELADFGAPSSRQNWGPDPTNVIPPNPPTQGLANPAFQAVQAPALTARKGLGLVLPIEIPTNYRDESTAYWSATGQPFGSSPVVCNGFAPSLPDAAPHGICPDGKTGLCVIPARIDPSTGAVQTFNCMTAAGVPARPGMSDNRAFNLWVVNDVGHFVLDGYTNPNLTLAAIRQNRIVTAYFRLHVSQADPINGGPTLTGVPTPAFPPGAPLATTSYCKALTSSDQIGCLVKANPCSIGFAGREAIDKAPSVPNNLGYQLGVTVLDARPPTDGALKALLDPSPTAAFYPMTRKLFVSHWVDPSLTTTPNDPNFENEEILYNCFKDPSKGNAAVGTFHFLQLDTGPVVDNACPNNR